MARRKVEIVQNESEPDEDAQPIDAALPNKDLFRVDEVARYFEVSDKTVRLWIEHGHFQCEQPNGRLIRIRRQSIINFRLRSTTRN